RRAATAAHAIGCFVLPYDPVRLAVNGGEGAGKRCVANRLLRAASVDPAAAVLLGDPCKGTAADRPRHIEIASLRAVRHWRPVGAALTRRLDHYRILPEGLEDAAGFKAG